jgi:HK97 family phage portal protein
MSSEYKPSIIVKVDAMTEEFSSPEGRQRLLDSYVKSGSAGEPWMIPAEQFDVEQVKPLTLSDLAIDSTMQLSKKTVASIMGVPAFLLGVGEYSKEEWNNFVQSTIRPIVISMQQELTRKLIISPGWYLRFNWWSLMDWSAQEISSVLLAGADRGFINGNEWRDRLGLEPVEGLSEYKVLENYIPIDKSGDQLKLIQDGGADGE